MAELLAVLLFAWPAEAGVKYSLARLEGAAIFLRHVSDSELEQGNATSCGLSSREALALTQPLKALRDEKIADERKRVKRTKSFLNIIKNCDKDCSCGVYADLLEGLPHWDKEAGEAAVKASNLDAKSVAKCANKEARWLCKSSLLKRLRRNAPPLP